MDYTNFDTFKSPAGGVELSDTLSSWRKKTNGIVMKVDSLDSTAGTLDGTVSALTTTVATSNVNNNSILLSKVQLLGSNKLLGNVGSGDGNVAAVEIDVTASGLQDSDDTIPTSKAVKDHVVINQRYISGRININGSAASLHGISVSRTEVGVYNIIVADSHQLPSGESYSVVAQIGVDVDAYGPLSNVINDAYHIHVFKIADIGGDPAYRVEIFELESITAHGGGNDHNDIVSASFIRRDAQFSVLGLPATDQ